MVETYDLSHFQEPTLFSSDSDSFGIETERLVGIPLQRVSPAELTQQEATPQASSPNSPQFAPDLRIIIEHLAPKDSHLHTDHRIEPSKELHTTGDTVMTDQVSAARVVETPGLPTRAIDAASTLFNANKLQETATAGLLEHEATTKVRESEPEALERRHDSHQEHETVLLQGKPQSPIHRDSPSLKLDTRHRPNPSEGRASSPNLKEQKRPMTNAGVLPAFHDQSPAGERSARSPHNATLPSIHQVFPQQLRQLGELAEAAAAQAQRDSGYSHQHSSSFGSATSQSPILPYHPYPGHSHMSPAAYSARTPTSAFGDPYGSPTHRQPVAYYNDRRSSAPAGHAVHPPPSLPSVSSSGESHGHASSADGYSTTHTTPSDQPEVLNPNRVLPPIPGMPMAPGYKCDVDGCNVPPFQTQYLLTSHKTVHSSSRPHYCPVKDCPRSEGGKGFKRKNEMIRHGLVHESPGYICPFCPDREHRYPRPDNLQRHVRVHHVDKDRDDPDLRAVLAQRSQGAGKTRRRRANTGGSGS